MNKKLKPFFYAALILVLAGIIFYPKLAPLVGGTSAEPEMVRSAGPQALNVEALIIKPIKLVEQINSSGTLIPDEQVELSFETSGKIVNINFDEGTAVRKGQLLAKINDRPLQAQLLKLQAQKKLAEEREFRQRTLLSRDAISQEAYDQATTELQSLEADMMLLEARIAETEMRAPFDGIIGLRHVSEGSFVGTQTPIARLVKSNPLKIEFAVPERYGDEVIPGLPISFILDGYADPFSAQVYAVEPKVDVRTRNILVRALFSNPQSRIKPGRFVSIQIDLRELPDAIAIPSESLIPEMDGDRIFVYRGGRAESKVVTTGMRTEDQVQITSGLEPGDTLVTTGILQLRQGMPLTIDKIN